MLRRIGLAVVVVALLSIIAEPVHARGGARSSSSVEKTLHVHGYYRQNGTYVQSHDRSAPGTGSATSRSYTRHAANTFDETPPASSAKSLTTSKRSTTGTTTTSSTSPQQTTTLTNGRGTVASQSQLPANNTVTTSPLTISPFAVPLDSNAAAQRMYGPLLHNAKQLIKAGIYGPAATYLQRIVNGAPGTRIAAEAQRLLAALPV